MSFTSSCSRRSAGTSLGSLARAASTSADIPIVSLDDDLEGGRLADAFAEFGCCYLTGHGISTALETSVMASARFFCELPESVKEAIPVVQSGDGFTRGFIGIGKESGSVERVEVKEAFSYGFEWEEGRTAFGNGLQGPNVWPSERDWPVENRRVMNQFFGKMTGASRAVSRHLSRSLYADEGFLDSFCQQGDTISIMRLFHYFPYATYGSKPVPEGFQEFIGSSPHTDWGFLTLILQDPVGGLQVLHRNEWIDVPYVPGTLVANAGDYLSLTTNGRCLSPVHRVIADDRERYSMVFFYYPDFDAVIPSVEEEALRIGGGKAQTSDEHARFNNLLDGTVRNADGSFGEYIMDKWAGVQRA
jgi:isopenicillin N synthase-like dioxygenase